MAMFKNQKLVLGACGRISEVMLKLPTQRGRGLLGEETGRKFKMLSQRVSTKIVRSTMGGTKNQEMLSNQCMEKQVW
jgi:hypothetical protein